MYLVGLDVEKTWSKELYQGKAVYTCDDLTDFLFSFLKEILIRYVWLVFSENVRPGVGLGKTDH